MNPTCARLEDEMSIFTCTTRITHKWLERKSKHELASIIMANIEKIDLFAEPGAPGEISDSERLRWYLGCASVDEIDAWRAWADAAIQAESEKGTR